VTQTTETEIRELRDLIVGLREETRVGFAELRGEIQKSEARTDTKFAEVRGDIKVIEERTKLGFWGFVGRAIVIAVLVSVISVVNKFVFGGGLGSLDL
jgi:hypothetical protein